DRGTSRKLPSRPSVTASGWRAAVRSFARIATALTAMSTPHPAANPAERGTDPASWRVLLLQHRAGNAVERDLVAGKFPLRPYRIYGLTWVGRHPAGRRYVNS